MLKIAVCDDEKIYLKRIEDMLRLMLDKNGISIYKIDTYLSGNDFFQNNKIFEYDVIFLDINMPEINGLEVARKIRENRPDILLVFITAFMDYALEGYKMEVIRFLLKDMLEEMLPECVETVIRKLSLQARKLKYSFMEGEKEVPVDSIYFIESQKHKLIYHILDSKLIQYSLYDKLDNAEKELFPYGFLRIHKSFLVNTKYIQNVVNYKVQLNNGMILPVPRERFQKIKERYYEFKGDMI